MKTQQRTKRLSIFLLCLGVMIIAAGIIVNILVSDDLIGGICLGYGVGGGFAIVSWGIGSLIRSKMPVEKIRRQEVESKDERSVMIREKSAYNAHFIMTIAFSTTLVVLSILNITAALFTVCGLTLLHHCSYLFFLHRNGKKL